MTIPRFYCDMPLGQSAVFGLPEGVAHHAVRVLRLKVGDDLVLFDGAGGEHLVRIDRIEGAAVTVFQQAFSAREAESPLVLWLGQALCANEKMDWVFQKAIELGVTRCSPLQTERSVVRLSQERALRRQAHWQGVIRAACEQSGRNRVPPVDPVQSLNSWFACLPAQGMRLMLSPQGGATLSQLASPAGPVAILVGPEGGLTVEEEAAARAAGFLALNLGPRILRTETAALALVATLQGLWGDFVEAQASQPL
ncbi:MAG: 16S rRNA (uracil(1498)-N(3))-methyltransferase [Ferrovum sp.]|nr:16S rRNA (uracil(1498)-N(3))-methyltransferase [Ferrovum sp.]